MKQVLLIALFALCSSVFAQEKKLTFGVQAGYSRFGTSEKDMANIDNSVTYKHTTLGFLVAGAYINYHITSLVSVQPEILFSQKGFKRTIRINDGFNQHNISDNYKINYIAIPILAKFSFGPEKSIFALSGLAPQFSFSANHSAGIGTYEILNLKKFDTPIVIGVGIEKPLGSTIVNLNVRYNIGLLNTFNEANARMQYNKPDSRLSSFMILAGIRI